MSDRHHYVYRAYDADDRVLYIGCTGNPEQRRASHRSSSDWWPYATRFEVAGPYERAVALERENAEIRDRRPYFNVLIPEGARLTRKLARREREIEERLLEEAGWSREKLKQALDDRRFGVLDDLRPLFTAAHELALAEVGLRTTGAGRLRHYLNIANEDERSAA